MGATVVRPHLPASWIGMRLAGRFIALRQIRGQSAPGQGLLDESGSLFPSIDSRAVSDAIWQTGFAEGLDLPTDMVERLTAFFRGRTCYVNGDRSKPAATVEQAHAAGAVTAYFYDTMDSPDIRALVDDPKLRNIATRYFASAAHHLGNQAWWSFPRQSDLATQSEFAQLYHFDLDAWRFLKFFFYMTDVNEGTGEHVYVLGSHRERPFKYQRAIRRFTEEEVDADFPASAIKRVTGRAGAGFVEDTFGLHRGEPPRTGARLYFEIEFANRDYRVPNDAFDRKGSGI